MVKDTLNVNSYQNHGKNNDMKRLSAIGIIIILFLLNMVSVSAGTVTDLDMVHSPEFPIVAVLIAFLTGIIGAVIFIVGTHKGRMFAF